MTKKTDEVEIQTTEKTVNEASFTKKQIVTSKKYASNKDLLQVLLEDNKKYTSKEVDKLIKEFRERKV